MIKGIMFDMGGTLVNVSLKEGAFMVIYNHLVDKPKDLDEFLAFSKQVIKDTFEARTTIDFDFRSFINIYLRYYDTKLDVSIEEAEDIYQEALFDFEKVDKIEELLTKCKKENLKLIVLSNTFFSSRAISKVLDKLGLLKYFDKVVASSECLVRKPSPIFFEIGIKEIGLDKNEVMYIGNDYNFDCVGCLISNIKMIFYNHENYQKYELFETIKEIKDYSELLEVDLCQMF